MITIPPRHYCVVENPVLRDKDGHVIIDANGQIKLGHADQVTLQFSDAVNNNIQQANKGGGGGGQTLIE